MMTTPDASPLESGRHIYVLYNARTAAEVEDASVLFATDNLAEARAKRQLLGPHCLLYVYRIVGGMAVDGRHLRDDE